MSMNYLVFGPPGAGKGTFSQYLKDNYGYIHLSAGDLVRNEIKANNPLIKSYEADSFVPDEIMHALIEKKLTECVNKGKPFVLDGFGRTKESMVFLIDLLGRLNLSKISTAVYLDSSNATCISRILTRKICRECGNVFNMKTALPAKPDTCDTCEGHLEQRMNDNEEFTSKRLSKYRSTISSVYEIAGAHFPTVRINTEAPLSECYKQYNLLPK